jgi:hypothetical protein
METDQSFPENDAVHLETESRYSRSSCARKRQLDWRGWRRRSEKEIEQTPILAALANTENLLHWTRFFGPLPGLDTKLEQPRER